MTIVDRRSFLAAGGAGAALSFIPSTHAAPVLSEIPDTDWRLWIDRDARYEDDLIFLPDQVDLAALPIHIPTGGWAALWRSDSLAVTLPATVEEHYWGEFGSRSYTGDEYRYAEDDPVPQNGAYRGVSWWYREINIPRSAADRRLFLHIRGARLRAEVFLNEQLVGYSIMSELPIHCDLTRAMRVGAANRLAIRITNPGGRFDWRDSTTMSWGAVRLFASHGFGGLDRGMTLSAHPLDAHIRDAWVLNTPDPYVVTAHMEVVLANPPREVAALRKMASVMLEGGEANAVLELLRLDGNVVTVVFRVTARDARLWEVDAPQLYKMRFRWGQDERRTEFGFRWFGVEGVGTNALLRLNGRRIKLYSAISWGYWGYNGLWPTAELAAREVISAKELGLNCLHFHRNIGKEEVFAAQDRLGLLRVMEPGGGRHAIGRDLKQGESLKPADRFSREFMAAKCIEMVRCFRSHPSLAHYTLQNEIGANLQNPDVQAILKAIHEADPSRTVILNDGFVERGAAQAMYLPYDDHYYRSDVEKWGGWWVNHQGAGDQWYDRFYKSRHHYIHRQTGKPFIVEFGEMQGCAVADNHAAMVAEIESRGAKAYDLVDHREILAGTDAFLDRWGFRDAFPTSEALFLSIGRKCYDAWENYHENIRIGDEVDIAAISGWESTAIENHSGIVDNLRRFKADPAIIRRSLLPVRPCAKQERLVYRLGETARLDLYLFNDTGMPAPGSLTLSVTTPDGRKIDVAIYAAPEHERDIFCHFIAEKAVLPAFAIPGPHRVGFTHSAFPEAAFEREFWVVPPAPVLAYRPRIALAGVAQSLRDALADLTEVSFESFRPGRHYDGIIASGLKAHEITRRQIGEETGLEEQPKAGDKPESVAGELDRDVLAAVKGGTPLYAIVPEDGLADGVARQLAKLGLFRYDGQVGNLRAPWMGNWNYLRAHRLFEGIPVDCATSVLHQVEGQPSNGLLIEGPGVEVIAGYSRDHDRHNGAAVLIAQQAKMRVALHRLPEIVAPLQQRLLANIVRWLAEKEKG